MIIQYTILFSLHSLTIEAAISSSTTSGSIRGSAADIVGGGHSHESELLNYSSNNDEDRHRFLQIATDVSMFLDCMMIQYVDTPISISYFRLH